MVAPKAVQITSTYRITGKFGDGFNLVGWRVYRQLFTKFKIAKHCAIALCLCDRVSVIAKLKTRQYVQKTDSANLELAKFSYYTVVSLPLLDYLSFCTCHVVTVSHVSRAGTADGFY